jgi:predicted transcriptional regulator
VSPEYVARMVCEPLVSEVVEKVAVEGVPAVTVDVPRVVIPSSR